MTDVKICGVKTKDVVETAVNGGASYVGFVHVANSPRYISPEPAAALRGLLPSAIKAVSVVVDADDAMLKDIIMYLMPDFLQLHGNETPERVREIRGKFGIKVIKAIPVASAEDVAKVHAYADMSDMLMFDAKAPKDAALPGGNGVSFDWNLLKAARINKPWILSGGLTPENIKEAVHVSGAVTVDVSSGVESVPGVKNIAKITAFMNAAKNSAPSKRAYWDDTF